MALAAALLLTGVSYGQKQTQAQGKGGKATAPTAASAPAATTAAPAGQGGDPLSSQRWISEGHGLSLRPPLGARVLEQTADDAVARIVGKPPYTITIYLRRSEKEVDLPRVQTLAIEQMAVAQPSAIIQEQRDVMIAGRPGIAIYFRIPMENKPAVAIAQSFVLMDPLTVMMVQLDTAYSDLPAVKGLYEAVLQSIELRDPAVVAKERGEAVKRFTTWMAKMDARQWKAALVSQQWLRLVEGKTDIGYMLIEQKPDTAMEQPGFRIDVKARVQVGPDYYDSLSTFFASEDMTVEMWSVRTTVRPQGRQLTPEEEFKRSWAESGLRSNGSITITRESPEGKKEFKWDEPAVYVPQVAIYLMGPMLPREGAELGFYAYSPNSGKVGYRTEQVKQTKDGFEVHSRPAPDLPIQVSAFDPQGKLQRRTLTENRSLIPASPQEVQARWKLR